MSDAGTSPPTSVSQSQPQYSSARKWLLIVVFCLAQYLDSFNNSALFPTTPTIAKDLSIPLNEVTWLFAAYSSTFAAFLLIAGRISDVYQPKPSFIFGVGTVGILSAGAGFVKNKEAMFVLRALSGIGGAMTIPSAFNLIVQIFPDPRERARAIALFGGSGAIGNVTGILIGAVFVECASWRWIFWFVGILTLPMAITSFFLIPSRPRPAAADRPKLDLVGVTLCMASLIMFVFALTSGAAGGWGAPPVIVTLVLSVVLMGLFLTWEAWIDEKDAALPPSTWRYSNLGLLVGISPIPYLYWFSTFVVYSPLWQDFYGWSTIMCGLRYLPIGTFAFIISFFAGDFSKHLHIRYVILLGLATLLCATILLPFADRPSRYWAFIFPAFSIGTVGSMVVLNNVGIAIFQTTPPEIAGVAGALFNAACQLGSAVGVAVITAIQTSVDAKKGPEYRGYAGRAATWWFVVGVLGVACVAVGVLWKVEDSQRATDVEDAKDGLAVGHLDDPTPKDEKMIDEKHTSIETTVPVLAKTA